MDERHAGASVKFNGFSQPADLPFSFSGAAGQEQTQPRTAPSRSDSSLNWQLKFDKKNHLSAACPPWHHSHVKVQAHYSRSPGDRTAQAHHGRSAMLCRAFKGGPQKESDAAEEWLYAERFCQRNRDLGVKSQPMVPRRGNP
jgi:hypothetical protein